MRSALYGVCALLALAAAPVAAAEADPASEQADLSGEQQAPAGAQQGPARQGGPDWEVVVTPYAWLTALTGEASARGATVDIDASISDVLSNTNVALFGALQVRRNRVVFMLDGLFAQLEDDFSVGARRVGVGPLRFERTLSVDTPLGPVDVPVVVRVPRVETSVGPTEINSEIEQIMGDAMLGYRLVDRPLASLFGEARDDDPRRFAFDLYGGLRYWHVETTIDVDIPPVEIPSFSIETRTGEVRIPLPDPGAEDGILGGDTVVIPSLRLPDVEVPGVTLGGLHRSFSETYDWVDPLLGAHARVDLSDRFSLDVLGDVGGFGIGSASKFTWQAAAILGYHLGEHWSLRLGYRALSNYREKIQLVMHGPLIGASYRF